MSGTKKLLKYLKAYRKESILAPLFKLLEAFFELLVPLVVAGIIDRGIAEADQGYIFKMGGCLIGLAVIGLLAAVTAQFFAAKAAVGFATRLRREMFEHIQGLDFTTIDRAGTSTLITRMTSDINQVQNGVNMVLRLFLRSPIVVFGAMIMAFTIDIKAALIFVVVIPLLSLVVFGIMLITIPLYKKVQSGLDKLLGITRGNLTGVRVLRAFHKEEDEIAQFSEANEALTGFQMYVGRISAVMNPVTYIIVNGGLVILLWTGALRVEGGILTQGAVLALVNYMSQILVELVKLANLIITVNKALACGNRVAGVLDMEPGLTEGTCTEGEQGDVPVVEFDHVHLTYPGAGAESLTDVHFKAMRGQTIGIIGGTGSGKSSLVNLIPRFYEATGGSVKVDGVKVEDYSLNALRSKIGVVLQKAVLFKGTIRENLLMGLPNGFDKENTSAVDKLLREALEVSQSAEFVDNKPEGMETQVSQGGKNLSGGQKQRLTIARALVRKPEILILDDSASALDYATDLKLRKAIRAMEKAPVVFIVSQRASSIMHADNIIVLDDGEVAGMGTHEELLNSCETYQEIYYSQYPDKKKGENA